MTSSSGDSKIAVCLALTDAISRATCVEHIYEAALDALRRGLGVERSSILLFEADGVMRFKAWRGLSEPYRRAVEGHTPWTPDTRNPRPLVVPDVRADATLEPFLPALEAEGISAMAFVPLVSAGRVIGKFMLYYGAPRDLSADELMLAGVIAAQVAFAVGRTRAEEAARRSEERLRFALDSAMMGTWDWDLSDNSVRWSDNLERIHGLPAATFDGTFASYEREIHPDDHERVAASIRRAIDTDAPHEVEYRIVGPDGAVRWVEGKGRVERLEGRPIRMTGVCMNVTRRKQAELERLAAAEEANRLKDEFLAVLSHELRTPLNAILGWVQILRAEEIGEERVRRALDVIERNARLQTQLIEDMLDVSRIVAGKLEIDRVPVLVASIVDQVVAAIRPAAHTRRLNLSSDVVSELPPIEGDPYRLQQVLSNLLSNAVKFTPEGGRIAVTCSADAEAVSIEVADSGIGIAPQFLPHVFERFRQADSATTRQQGGLGLGLAIARHLVECHGGTLGVESVGPGLGSTFTVRLPLMRAAALTHAVGPAASTV